MRVSLGLAADRSAFVGGAPYLRLALEVVGLDLVDVETGPRDVLGDVSGQMAAAREPSLLPPPLVVQPMPLEIRNPHVMQAAPASFEMPLAWPSTSR